MVVLLVAVFKPVYKRMLHERGQAGPQQHTAVETAAVTIAHAAERLEHEVEGEMKVKIHLPCELLSF